MNTGRRKIWIQLTKKTILIKFTDKKIDNIFYVNNRERREYVMKKSKIKRALIKKVLRLKAYMSDFGGQVFSEFTVSEDLYRMIKDFADREIYEYEKYEEESILF